MTEYEKMRQDGWEPSGRDREIYQNKDKEELLIHPDDPNFVKPLSGGSWKRYDPDEHNK